MTRRKRSSPTEEQLAGRFGAACWLAQFSDFECYGPIQLCHLIPKQRLRQRGIPEELIWAPALLVHGCERHHWHLDISRTLRIPREALPPELEVFAAEHDLLGSLDRDYGALQEAA